jgi:C_GCAxxG_C_C family probable redox protein
MRAHQLNCAQSVVSVFCEDFGLEHTLGLKVAVGFGGGMARGGRTCGAVTGAYMVLGLSQRVNEDNPRESLERVYNLIHEFNRRFKEIHGSLICRELIKYDLSLPEQRAAAHEKAVFTTVCPDFVRDAVSVIEAIRSTY